MPEGAKDDANAGTETTPGQEVVGDARELTRQRIVEAAADLLSRQGRDAVTTRAVAAAAGMQAPVIYRLFGDKDGLLEAVAGHGYAVFLAAKHQDNAPEDPVEDLRAGWDLAAEFGLANPELFTLMYGDPGRGTTSAAFQAGMRILMGRIRRVAAAGRLRVDEPLAAALMHATTRGAVLTWLSLPEDRREPALLTTMRETMIATITYDEPAVREPGLAAAARALRARLPGQKTPLSDAEQHLLGEWLDRLAADGRP
ncbi:TetR/AcrR family transcriptional regulator [Actinoallomurus spadix]|uniref:TetR/AcrR family transcriptional regulator n=1 Tax=Actinoallomurus spadix TaxID=79912 RepID=A0ABP3FRG7_9ACTN|nr:TetR/AcrR family transcriptional regulator [Actinoallomurus spadix]MCO5985389.1 TetR/AcrR family transcriptional regulator [Actinoallomurus spadix]